MLLFRKFWGQLHFNSPSWRLPKLISILNPKGKFSKKVSLANLQCPACMTRGTPYFFLVAASCPGPPALEDQVLVYLISFRCWMEPPWPPARPGPSCSSKSGGFSTLVFLHAPAAVPSSSVLSAGGSGLGRVTSCTHPCILTPEPGGQPHPGRQPAQVSVPGVLLTRCEGLLMILFLSVSRSPSASNPQPVGSHVLLWLRESHLLLLPSCISCPGCGMSQEVLPGLLQDGADPGQVLRRTAGGAGPGSEGLARLLSRTGEAIFLRNPSLLSSPGEVPEAGILGSCCAFGKSPLPMQHHPQRKCILSSSDRN